MKTLLFICGIFTSYLLTAQNDTLYRVFLDRAYLPDEIEVDAPCSFTGYIDSKGKMVIPIGKYASCHTDQFIHYAVVVKQGHTRPVAINRKGKELFNVFWFTGGPDRENEGMIRIVGSNGKIGYADSLGRIVIKPRFSWGSQFIDGVAKVTYDHREAETEYEIINEIDSWLTIDKTGKVIATPKQD